MDAANVKAKRREERVKLFASALSNVGVAAVVSGVVAPLVLGKFQGGLAAGAFLLGFGLHLAAQCVLHYVVSDTTVSGGG